MYVGVGIKEGINLLSQFLVQNLKKADLKSGGGTVIFIPDSFEELLQTKKSVSGLWALGDVYAALEDYIHTFGEDSRITKKGKNNQNENLKLKDLRSPIRNFYTNVYKKRNQLNYWGIPDRLPINLDLGSDTISIGDPSQSSAHLCVTVNYMSIEGLAGDDVQKEIVKLLLSSDEVGWYVDGKANTGLQNKYGWPIFPRDNAQDNKARLVDSIASLNVIENLAIYQDNNLPIFNDIVDEKKCELIFKAWATSILELTSKDQNFISEDILSKDIISFIKEHLETAKELNVDLEAIAQQHPESAKELGVDLEAIAQQHPESAKELGVDLEVIAQQHPESTQELGVKKMFHDSHNFVPDQKIFRAYHDICRSLLAISGIFEIESFYSIIKETKDNLSNILLNMISTLITQLEKDIISVEKIHDRGRVFRRSNGLVVQYIGVGSALILYSILRALKTVKMPFLRIVERIELEELAVRSIIRTLIIKVLQQIMTEKHIDCEPTGSLKSISTTIKSPNILQDYEIVGGYVFDECLPGKADAYEFIFFWQSAYALRALLLCQDLAQNNPNEFSWLTSL